MYVQNLQGILSYIRFLLPPAVRPLRQLPANQLNILRKFGDAGNADKQQDKIYQSRVLIESIRPIVVEY